MAKRSKYMVKLDKAIQKKFWRALTPTDRDMNSGTENKVCSVCEYTGNVCARCSFYQFENWHGSGRGYGCYLWRNHFDSDWEWYNLNLEQGRIPKSARPLFHKFYREFRKKIRDYIEWV